MSGTQLDVKRRDNQLSAAAIRVCVRFRPTQSSTDHSTEYVDHHLECYGQDSVLLTRNGEDRTFTFDRVFDSNITQEKVYQEVAAPILDDVWNGYNATIMAYGQTGSGKTFTMLGESEHPGIIPRLMTDMFIRMNAVSSEATGSVVSISVQCVELYNEQIYDLICPSNTSIKLKGGSNQALVQMVGCSTHQVCTMDDIENILAIALANRATHGTQLNHQSSRSHMVLVVKLVQSNEAQGTLILSNLLLVDLAGSENVKQSDVHGQQLAEAKYINQSLSTLSLVIHDLSEKKSFIRYRDSKLTRLLSDSLGGNSKVLLLLACSPEVERQRETLLTLDFGKSAKRVVNRPKVNQELSIEACTKMIEELQLKVKAYEEKESCVAVVEPTMTTAAAAVANGNQKQIQDHEEEMMSYQMEVEQLHMQNLSLQTENDLLQTIQNRRLDHECDGWILDAIIHVSFDVYNE